MNSIRGLPRGSANVFRHFLKQARKDQQRTRCSPGQIGGLIGGAAQPLKETRIGCRLQSRLKQF